MTFFIMHAIPGDPFIGEHVLSQEALDALYAHYKLDQSLWVQYIFYIKRLLSLDLGYSLVYPGLRVTELIASAFPVSAYVGLEALILAISLGICLGAYSALKKTTWQDTAIMSLSATLLSIPHFVAATLLQWLIAVRLGILPIASWGSFSHTILPAIALAILPAATIARLTRTNMVKVLEEPYIQTAKAKGLSSMQIILRHALRNTLLPTITYLAPLVAHIALGSLVIETIFSIPGLGKWMIHSIIMRDYPLILGLTLFFSSFLMLSMFIIDIIYGLIDPRIRWSSKL